jgi:hypothetical protein
MCVRAVQVLNCTHTHTHIEDAVAAVAEAACARTCLEAACARICFETEASSLSSHLLEKFLYYSITRCSTQRRKIHVLACALRLLVLAYAWRLKQALNSHIHLVFKMLKLAQEEVQIVANRLERYSRSQLQVSAYVSIRQHTSAYVSIRQHTSAYVRIYIVFYSIYIYVS